MKKLNVLLLAALLLFGAQATVFAQSKVAHINTSELISIMPETKAAEGQLEKLEKTYVTQINEMKKELEQKYRQY
ncbi:OmpH family outer membrane protein, partial [Flavobacteriaceae bacterium]|nr:OmpH family outer membrane protein [Flavobacteriaceae bacterium]